MTTEDDGGGSSNGNDASAALLPHPSPAVNRQADDGNLSTFFNGGIGKCTTSDNYSEHAPSDAEPLPLKLVKSKSNNKIRESKEVFSSYIGGAHKMDFFLFFVFL